MPFSGNELARVPSGVPKQSAIPSVESRRPVTLRLPDAAGRVCAFLDGSGVREVDQQLFLRTVPPLFMQKLNGSGTLHELSSDPIMPPKYHGVVPNIV